MRNNSVAQQTTRRGGQTSLGLFGVPGFDAPRQPLSRCSVAPAARHQSSLIPARRPSLDDEPQLAHSRWLADLADACGCSFDEVTAAYARSFAGAGMAEHLMALEG